MEYALASSDTVADSSVLPTVAAADPHATFTFRRNLAADDVIYSVEVSNDFENWSSDHADVLFVSSSDSGYGYALVTYRCALPFNPDSRQFMRLEVSIR